MLLTMLLLHSPISICTSYQYVSLITCIAWMPLAANMWEVCNIRWLIVDIFLPAGLSEQELDNFEQRNDFKLPRDVRCIYRFHNGQKFHGKRPYGYVPVTLVKLLLLDCDNVITFTTPYTGDMQLSSKVINLPVLMKLVRAFETKKIECAFYSFNGDNCSAK